MKTVVEDLLSGSFQWSSLTSVSHQKILGFVFLEVEVRLEEADWLLALDLRRDRA